MQSGYVVRCIEAARTYGSMCFITLTYSDKSVPLVEKVDDESGELIRANSLRRNDVRLWKKRLRVQWKRKFGESFPDFAYLICGEYGPRTNRPHYHGVLFGLSREHLDFAAKIWQDTYGFTCFKEIPLVSLSGHDNVASVARYVAKYVCKFEEFEYDLVRRGIVEKPRKLTSVGFGVPNDFDRWRDHVLALDTYDYDPKTLTGVGSSVLDAVLRRLRYTYKGFDYAIPSYLMKKLLYEKDCSGVYKASSLSRMVSSVIRSKFDADYNERLRSYLSGVSDGEIPAKIVEFTNLEKAGLQSRYDAARKDNIKVLQKSAL